MFDNVPTLVLAVLLSLLCGTGVFLHGVRENTEKATFLNLFTEWVLSLIAGLTGYYIAVHEEWNDSLMFIIVIIASNNWREFSGVAREKLFSVVGAIFGNVGNNGGGGGNKNNGSSENDTGENGKKR